MSVNQFHVDPQNCVKVPPLVQSISEERKKVKNLKKGTNISLLLFTSQLGFLLEVVLLFDHSQQKKNKEAKSFDLNSLQPLLSF